MEAPAGWLQLLWQSQWQQQWHILAPNNLGRCRLLVLLLFFHITVNIRYAFPAGAGVTLSGIHTLTHRVGSSAADGAPSAPRRQRRRLNPPKQMTVSARL